MNKPTGKLLFAYQSIAILEKEIAELKKQREWMPVSERSPDKHPLDVNMNSPHFIALCSDGYAHQCWWSFPQEGSLAYEKNHPPKIERIIGYGGFGFISESNIKFWKPLPEPPKDEDK